MKDSNTNNSESFLEMIERYHDYFNLRVPSLGGRNLTTSEQTGIIKQALETNTPIPINYAGKSISPMNKKIDQQWLDAIKRYIDHFELSVPEPDRWSHVETIRMIDDAIKTNTPLPKRVRPEDIINIDIDNLE